MSKHAQGDRVKIAFKDKNSMHVVGIFMSRAELLSDDVVVIKLDNGYNIGIDKKRIAGIRVLENYRQEKSEMAEIPERSDLPTISILHTGGTIASKVDYKTGAVVASFTPEEITGMFPEISDIANINSRLIFQMFSEDFEPEHWCILAKDIAAEIKKGVNGVIVTHGTDTMGYTSAALSFMLHNIPVPVILVGSQRSSDRGSSDSYLNMICAARFIANTDFAGVGVCMHATSSDSYCYIHNGTNVRKMHSSSRSAFQSINTMPIARVFEDGVIDYLLGEYPKKSEKGLIIQNEFNKKIAIVKIMPGFDYAELRFFEKRLYKGIVLEGTGMGHAPVTVLDKYTNVVRKDMPIVPGNTDTGNNNEEPQNNSGNTAGPGLSGLTGTAFAVLSTNAGAILFVFLLLVAVYMVIKIVQGNPGKEKKPWDVKEPWMIIR